MENVTEFLEQNRNNLKTDVWKKSSEPETAARQVLDEAEVLEMLFEDLRIDEYEFAKLDRNFILKTGEKYHCNNLKCLMKYMQRRTL